jgi:alpha-1,4-digalacturonate transport system permease protein
MAQASAAQRDTANYRWWGAELFAFLFRRKGGKRLTAADVITYLFLILGTVVMFFPVVWLVMSSFKPITTLYQTPPTFFPYHPVTIQVPGYPEPLPLVDVRQEDGSVKRMARVGRIIGVEARVIDLDAPNEPPVRVRLENITPVQEIRFDLSNYTNAIDRFPFGVYLRNSVVITISATALTLLINSMAAYALSKYRFRGRNTIFLLILSALMVPLSVIMIPVFLVISRVGMAGSLLGVIIPPAATPTGVFLLRQYMLTIPDELIEAARIDGASEWRIYWRIVMPLAAPALAVLAIFSFMWRWNDFLWPLIVLGGRSDLATLQLGLQSFQGELNVQWDSLLAMTVLSLLPVVFVFGILQKYITTGIASTGLKG